MIHIKMNTDAGEMLEKTNQQNESSNRDARSPNLFSF